MTNQDWTNLANRIDIKDAEPTVGFYAGRWYPLEAGRTVGFGFDSLDGALAAREELAR